MYSAHLITGVITTNPRTGAENALLAQAENYLGELDDFIRRCVARRPARPIQFCQNRTEITYRVCRDLGGRPSPSRQLRSVGAGLGGAVILISWTVIDTTSGVQPDLVCPSA